MGWQIVMESLEKPFLQIITNAGLKSERLLVEYEHYYLMDATHVYDVRAESFVNGYEEGIIDPTQVVLSVIQHAVSVASTVGMVACAIYRS
jgi:chaperonin GroEL